MYRSVLKYSVRVRTADAQPLGASMSEAEKEPFETELEMIGVMASVIAMFDTPPDLVYHYTTSDAFAKILETGNIWQTNAAYLNDHAELTYPVGLARSVLAERESRADADHLRECYSLASGVLEIHRGFKLWYVASFSRQGNLLSQWRAYCPGGGFSVGFNGPPLVQILRSSGADRFGPVEYDEGAQRQRLDQTIQRYENFLSSAPSRFPQVDLRKIVEKTATALAFKLSADLIFFKLPAFKEEAEWRLATRVISEEGLRFRDRQGLLTPYVETSLLGAEGKLPLAEVFVGPLGDTALAKHAVTLVLSKSGYPANDDQIKWAGYRLRF